ncbi:MAG: P1 family peptidase [Acidimicrobiales bacterium]|nr:P1 family peptidase [Acidimicrobiales bacterium]
MAWRRASGFAGGADPVPCGAVALGIEGVAVGCWTHPDGTTGCTVVLPPPGTIGGCAVRGGAPGSRETPALRPDGSVQECTAIVLTGGSAFGLATADGVMRWCEAQGRGLKLPTVTVPIVAAAVVFDLREPARPRPDADAGWAACEAATEVDPPQGNVGVGAGCTVGKAAGRDHASRGGQGWAVRRGADGLVVSALMAVNPVGDVLDEQGAILAGDRAPADAPRFPYVPMERLGGWGEDTLRGDTAPGAPGAPGASGLTNTVIGCVVTNAKLSKQAACRAADLAHSGIARSVSPAHTSADGDLLFLLGTGAVEAPGDLVAHLAAEAVAAAIRTAVRHAEDGAGVPADPRARLSG